ncbi:MAG: Fic family protein [Balneolaceae bacterium]
MNRYDHPRQMEPMMPGASPQLVQRAMEVYRESASLESMLHPTTRVEVTRILRHINSYYSNRIEGEHTTPAEIERAVRKEYSSDESKRRLQQLSMAHIDVQELIDQWFEKEPGISVCSADFLCRIHREFYNRVPELFLEVRSSSSEEVIRMEPGRVRDRMVSVGRHLPPEPEHIGSFMTRFAEAYHPEGLSGHKKLLAAAASHHRLSWIHPFLDGNGRVCRLFSYAYMKHIHLDSLGLWSWSRGAARKSDEYRQMLALADSPRQGDLDGRGLLSEKGLAQFSDFFFEVAHDQIRFMAGLLQLDSLRERIYGYAHLRSEKLIPEEESLRIESKYLLAEAMTRGEVPRGEVSRITGLADRTARDLVHQLEEEELLTSTSHRAPLRFHIPGRALGYYFPQLYPEGTL